MKKNLILILLFLILLTSCNDTKNNSLKEKPKVVVSIPPYISIIKSIAGDTVSVESVVPKNFDPHTMEITPLQRKLIQKANLFIGIGETYEAKLLSTLINENKELSVLQLNEHLPLLTPMQEKNMDSMEHNHGDHTHHHHSHDLHFWLSPSLLPLQISLISESLSKLNPNLSETYTQNSKNLIDEVNQLHKILSTELKPYYGKALLVPHAALGYFCHDYGLIQIAVEFEGKSPLPNDLNQILNITKSSDVLCGLIFPQFNNKGLKIIANALSIRTIQFNPLSENLIENIRQLGQDIID